MWISSNHRTVATMGAGASSSSGNWRHDAIIRQNDAHRDICNRLGRGNCEPNFFDALNKAKGRGVIDTPKYNEYRWINQQGNRAKHWWN